MQFTIVILQEFCYLPPFVSCHCQTLKSAILGYFPMVGIIWGIFIIDIMGLHMGSAHWPMVIVTLWLTNKWGMGGGAALFFIYLRFAVMKYFEDNKIPVLRSLRAEYCDKFCHYQKCRCLSTHVSQYEQRTLPTKRSILTFVLFCNWSYQLLEDAARNCVLNATQPFGI